MKRHAQHFGEAQLWNRSMLRIPRKEIVWDRQNMRWEAKVLAP